MSSLSSFAALSISVAFAPFAAGCLFDASAFDSGSSSSSSGGHSSGGGSTTGGAGTTTTTGTGGSGAGTTSSGGQTSAGGTTTTTTTTPPECMMDGDCPDPAAECIGPRCIGGTCGSAPVNDGVGCNLPLGDCDSGAACMSGVCTAIHKSAGTVIPDPSENCVKAVCDGNGNAMKQADPDDHPGSDDCHQGYCDGMTPSTMPLNEGGNCLFSIGKCCGGGCCLGAEGCCPNGACKYVGILCI